MHNRRHFLAGIGVSALALSSGAALARSSDPLTIIVPYSAGGSNDGMARVLADHLTRKLGRNVLVENKPGANGMIAAQMVASGSKPQNTLYLGGTGNFSLNMIMRRKLAYELGDFRPVAYLSSGPMCVTVPVSLGVESFEDFINLAKTREKPLRFGTFGPGSLSQVFGAIMQEKFGFNAIEVAYKSTAEEIRDIFGGHVDFTVSSTYGVLSHIKSGTMKMVATANPTRIPQLPETPTFTELGHPDVTTRVWTGLIASKAMDSAVVDEIASATLDVLSSDEMQSFMGNIGQDIVAGGPEIMAAQIDHDFVQFTEIVRARGLMID